MPWDKDKNIVLNGCDDMETAREFAATGVAGTMFDHFSILQFIERGPNSTGQWNASMMDQAFQMATSATVANMTLQVKGWPGPIVKQRDQYPPNGPPQLQTPHELWPTRQVHVATTSSPSSCWCSRTSTLLTDLLNRRPRTSNRSPGLWLSTTYTCTKTFSS